MSDPAWPKRPGPGPSGSLWQRWQAWLADSEAVAAGRLPRFFLLFLLLFGAGMILMSLVGDQGLIAYYGLRHDAARLRSQVQHLEAQQVELKEQIKALHDDPDYIAYLARTRLGLVKPGETVIQLPPPRPSP